MAGYSDIEIRFIKEELAKHSDFLADLLLEAIETKKLEKTYSLKETFKRRDFSRIFEKGGEVVLSFSFPDYGRFIEIQQKKKRRIRTEKPDINAIIWGIEQDKKKKKKGKNAQWYTRNVYGAQNRLIGHLMWGLTDIERERIIKALKAE